MERIKVNGFDGRVGFVCRYRNVNTYRLESASVFPGDRVDITDDGRFYHPEAVFSWGKDSVLAAIAEYERRCHSAYLRWAKEKSFPESEAPHAICALA